MGKKRKHSVAIVPRNDDTDEAPARKRTLSTVVEQPKEVQHKHEEQENGHTLFRNKEKVLVLSSRRITFRYRHLMMDIVGLLPHSKRDVKVQSKDNKAATLNELVDLRGCTSCLFFECRKKQDLYLWMSKCPSGPSVKFQVKAVHTMAELKLTGNHLKGSRPLMTFSSTFDMHPHFQLLKVLLKQIFCTPKDHRKSKPFFDHVFAFSVADNHVWFRNYQINVPHQDTDKLPKGALDKMTLIEVGPRFCLHPIKILAGSFGGQIIYENPFYVSPNVVRSQEKRAKAGKYVKKVKAKQRRKTHLMMNQVEPDELAGIWKE
ncbi:hypothetical protein KP509_16G037900 [Ceratopteris richardii]|uniref:Brix domain-containing protein n=1 Tax=Ceratopteris richardii TaxID=49495 RepID=A0A8T2SYU9_CERRI|nr:hypothetical protein KP509_16G037900 [Ceratopteris richardii]KAH7387720.1 hypothetical protein KP509_16G037900 [Ceratopteris richardii]